MSVLTPFAVLTMFKWCQDEDESWYKVPANFHVKSSNEYAVPLARVGNHTLYLTENHPRRFIVVTVTDGVEVVRDNRPGECTQADILLAKAGKIGPCLFPNGEGVYYEGLTYLLCKHPDKPYPSYVA